MLTWFCNLEIPLLSPNLTTIRNAVAVSLILGGAAHALWPQVAPAATGPRKYSVAGTLQYTLRYSQMMEFNSSEKNSQQIATFSGDLKYQSESERHPFTAIFGGGYLWGVAGVPYGDGFFQNLKINQGLAGRHWNLTVGDQLGYLKQTPALGTTGQPGTGGPIGEPNPNPPDQTVVALGTQMIHNNLAANYKRQITPGIAFTSAANYILLRFPNGSGIEDNQYLGDPGIVWRLNARSSILTGYDYSRYAYFDYDLTISANAVLAGYVHRWTRHLSTSTSAGPQWVSSSNAFLAPGILTYQINGAATYIMPRGSAGVTYMHGFYGGSGYVLGSTIDTANANLRHQFRSRWDAESALGYYRTQRLGGTGLISTRFAGAQVTKHLGRKLAVFGTYTAASQSYSTNISATALKGFWQLISVGAGYTPPPIHLDR